MYVPLHQAQEGNASGWSQALQLALAHLLQQLDADRTLLLLSQR